MEETKNDGMIAWENSVEINIQRNLNLKLKQIVCPHQLAKLVVQLWKGGVLF